MELESSKSNPELTRADLLVLAAVVAAGAGIYLLTSAWIYGIGFPLDDSWIHLTYARNLALYGQWAFQLGRPSAGSTAPLWTFLLAIGYWLHLAPYFWSYFLGALTLLGVAAVGEHALRKLVPSYRPRMPWIGIFLAAEWHLLWAAMSGMETLLQALLLTTVLVLLLTGSRRYLALGLLTGISVWVRPDGLTLLGPVVFAIFFVENTWSQKGRALLFYLIGLGSLLLPYLVFNLRLSGTPMPNTFYAKQTEYAAWQAQSIFYRVSVLLVQLLTGPGVVVFPGAVGYVVLAIRRRDWRAIAAILWCGGYLILYILRLPAYQHGRYLMPAMPIFFLFGLLAILEFGRSQLFGRRHWFAWTAWRLALATVTGLFLLLGAKSYGEDVGLIETEMVATAKWVASNLPANAVIAAHDIGALGYFDHHPLIDLAGLVSPEVVPFMRDESRLAEFVSKQHADYLIAFPAFYPELTRDAVPVFTASGKFAPEIGERHMTVYRWGK